MENKENISNVNLEKDKSKTEDRLDLLYDIVEKLEYRIVALENKIESLKLNKDRY